MSYEKNKTPLPSSIRTLLKDKEVNVKRKVINYLKKEYPRAWIKKLSDKWHSGIPDILMILYGYYVWVETKRPGETTTPKQDQTIEELRAAGSRVYVVESVEDLAEQLKITLERSLDND